MNVHFAGALWLMPLALAFLIAAGGTMLLSFASGPVPVAAPPGEPVPTTELPAFMGGFAIYFGLVAAAWNMGVLEDARYLLLLMCLMFVLGLWNTFVRTREAIDFAVQVIVTALLVRVAGVEFRNAGDLFGTGPLALGVLSLPITVMAMVALAYALTMMDDLEGFRAAFAFTVLAWFSLAAASSGLETQWSLALLFQAALGGYLLCSVMLRGRSRSAVFLGSGGGLMIGFALGWLAIDLTQGPHRTVPPIAALFVVMLPLADALSVMMRKIERKENPFERNERHLQHYLFARGCTPARSLVILVAAAALLGAVGFAGWRLHVPDAAMFWLAVFGFLAYHAWIKAAWRKVDGFYYVL
jgi:UDP-GlcNAc:undecaprenyl-phosphate GlcNAc-1-phosphate transferase